MKHCVFVLGMHRSGTSALSGVLNLMGSDFGSNLMSADEGNPKGYFENNLVYDLNKKILKENNSHWDDYTFRIEGIDNSRLEHYITEAKNIINNEFGHTENLVIKDPRNCMLFPVWEKACLELEINIKVILPYRNPYEVALSLSKRNNFSEEKSILLWCHHLLSAEYYSREYKRRFTFFNDLLNDSTTIIQEIENLTGLKSTENNLKKIKIFLDKKIKHNNVSLDRFTSEVPVVIKRIVQLIRKRMFDYPTLFDDIRLEFYLLLDLFKNKEIKQLNAKIKQLNAQDPKTVELAKERVSSLQQIKDLRTQFLNLNIENKRQLELRDQEIIGLETDRDDLSNQLNKTIQEFQIKKKEQETTAKELELKQDKHRNNIKLKNKQLEEVKNELRNNIDQLITIRKSNKQLVLTQTKLKNEVSEKENVLSRINAVHQEKIIDQNKTIEQLFKSQSKLYLDLKNKENEINKLNTRMTEIITDFIAIKESKSWKITKPIRLLIKIFRT